ncbi:MAG: NRDE family protein [Acidobacteriia bacterium]|nr:NRDE family protein [Methyloceanibacter sp.]MCL6492952.1 NRDE family protein [Terriglobia bacterium]
MCTVVLLLRPDNPWPLLLAANRDEMLNRPWLAPAAHWPEYPGIVGGRDSLAGGTWMAVNAHGVVATVLNRPGSLGTEPGKRSRGELPLIALVHSSAAAAARAIAALDAGAWRRFNMVIADAKEAFFLRGLGEGYPHIKPLPEGLSMVTAHDPNDATSPRIARHLPKFLAAPVPRPPDDWESWLAIMADSSGPPESQMNIRPQAGFGTICCSLFALPEHGLPIWRFAPGPPDRAEFISVALSAHETDSAVVAK